MNFRASEDTRQADLRVHQPSQQKLNKMIQMVRESNLTKKSKNDLKDRIIYTVQKELKNIPSMRQEGNKSWQSIEKYMNKEFQEFISSLPRIIYEKKQVELSTNRSYQTQEADLPHDLSPLWMYQESDGWKKHSCKLTDEQKIWAYENIHLPAQQMLDEIIERVPYDKNWLVGQVISVTETMLTDKMPSQIREGEQVALGCMEKEFVELRTQLANDYGIQFESTKITQMETSQSTLRHVELDKSITEDLQWVNGCFKQLSKLKEYFEQWESFVGNPDSQGSSILESDQDCVGDLVEQIPVRWTRRIGSIRDRLAGIQGGSKQKIDERKLDEDIQEITKFFKETMWKIEDLENRYSTQLPLDFKQWKTLEPLQIKQDSSTKGRLIISEDLKTGELPDMPADLVLTLETLRQGYLARLQKVWDNLPHRRGEIETTRNIVVTTIDSLIKRTQAIKTEDVSVGIFTFNSTIMDMKREIKLEVMETKNVIIEGKEYATIEVQVREWEAEMENDSSTSSKEFLVQRSNEIAFRERVWSPIWKSRGDFQTDRSQQGSRGQDLLQQVKDKEEAFDAVMVNVYSEIKNEWIRESHTQSVEVMKRWLKGLQEDIQVKIDILNEYENTREWNSESVENEILIAEAAFNAAERSFDEAVSIMRSHLQHGDPIIIKPYASPTFDLSEKGKWANLESLWTKEEFLQRMETLDAQARKIAEEAKDVTSAGYFGDQPILVDAMVIYLSNMQEDINAQKAKTQKMNENDSQLLQKMKEFLKDIESELKKQKALIPAIEDGEKGALTKIGTYTFWSPQDTSEIERTRSSEISPAALKQQLINAGIDFIERLGVLKQYGRSMEFKSNWNRQLTNLQDSIKENLLRVLAELYGQGSGDQIDRYRSGPEDAAKLVQKAIKDSEAEVLKILNTIITQKTEAQKQKLTKNLEKVVNTVKNLSASGTIIDEFQTQMQSLINREVNKALATVQPMKGENYDLGYNDQFRIETIETMLQEINVKMTQCIHNQSANLSKYTTAYNDWVFGQEELSDQGIQQIQSEVDRHKALIEIYWPTRKKVSDLQARIQKLVTGSKSENKSKMKLQHGKEWQAVIRDVAEVALSNVAELKENAKAFVNGQMQEIEDLITEQEKNVKSGDKAVGPRTRLQNNYPDKSMASEYIDSLMQQQPVPNVEGRSISRSMDDVGRVPVQDSRRLSNKGPSQGDIPDEIGPQLQQFDKMKKELLAQVEQLQNRIFEIQDKSVQRNNLKSLDDIENGIYRLAETIVSTERKKGRSLTTQEKISTVKDMVQGLKNVTLRIDELRNKVTSARTSDAAVDPSQPQLMEATTQLTLRAPSRQTEQTSDMGTQLREISESLDRMEATLNEPSTPSSTQKPV
jgi:hypothetical protein